MTATEQFKLMEAAEAIVNDDPKMNALFDVPSVSHQGDLTLVALPKLPKSAKPRKNRQLAEGTSKGSRHVMTRGAVYDADPKEIVKSAKAAYKVEVGEQYVGPVIVSPENPTENDLTHPEHGNQGFPAGTICAVIFQRNLDTEQREARVWD